MNILSLIFLVCKFRPKLALLEEMSWGPPKLWGSSSGDHVMEIPQKYDEDVYLIEGHEEPDSH